MNHKNLYILPTDKPSRLCFRNYYFINKDNLTTYSNVNFKNIYITNDEEIKDGDYGYSWNWHHKINKFPNGCNQSRGYVPKIILTTDPDLISDGVQAIDDEFLEWFVKNPSCEEVTVKHIIKDYVDEQDAYGYDVDYWKIIIPQEEPKCFDCKGTISKEGICFCNREEPKQDLDILKKEFSIKANEVLELNSNIGNFGKPKQETLEEAAEKLYPFAFAGIGNAENDRKKHFIKGAKWQAERMYSDFKSLWDFVNERCINHLDDELPQLGTFDEWFEQFKKK